MSSATKCYSYIRDTHLTASSSTAIPSSNSDHMHRSNTSAAANDHQGNVPPPRTAPLRIIRLPASKPWRRPERLPPQVYHVDCGGFRQLVQRLTGASPPPCPPHVPVGTKTTNAVGLAADPPVSVGGASGSSSTPPTLGGGADDSFVENSNKQSSDGSGELIWQPEYNFAAPSDWDDLYTHSRKHSGLDY